MSDNPGMGAFGSSMQSATKDAVARSAAALEELGLATRHNLEAMIASMNAAARGSEALRDQTLAYCQQVSAEVVESAKAVAQAQSPDEAVRVQTECTRRLVEGYAAELKRISETLQGSMQASIAPLQERAGAVMNPSEGRGDPKAGG